MRIALVKCRYLYNAKRLLCQSQLQAIDERSRKLKGNVQRTWSKQKVDAFFLWHIEWLPTSRVIFLEQGRHNKDTDEGAGYIHVVEGHLFVYALLKHWPASKAMETRRPIVKALSQPRLIFLPSRKRSESFYAAAAVQFKERYLGYIARFYKIFTSIASRTPEGQ